MNYRTTLLHLQHCKSINYKDIKNLTVTLPNLSSIYSLSFSTLQSILKSSHNKTKSLIDELQSIDINRLMKQYDKNNIQWMTIIDESYPKLLKTVYDPPFVLFLKGKSEILENGQNLAIVGSRKSNIYTEKVLENFIPMFVKNKLNIVSGLALGADSLAHRMAIEYKGNTIGVLGGGFEHFYPKENTYLIERMMAEQLVISEYPPSTRPEKWHFPMRNRIISGLSIGVFITQAKKKSGTLITADYALNEGRDVFAVPGSILDPLSSGTNELIQQGAKLILTPEDIFSELYV